MQAIREIVVQSSLALFSCYGHPAQLVEPAEPQEEEERCDWVGVMAFSGPLFQGMISIGSPEALLKSLYPLASGSESQPIGKAEVHEWLSELTNQLLGRVANMLARRGVRLSLQTPAALPAEVLKLVLEESPPWEKFTFNLDSTSLIVRVNVRRIADRMEIAQALATPAVSDAAQSEGDVVLFE